MNPEKNEEFNNFMYKVNEVNSIVEKLASNDKEIQNIGMLESQKYLKENQETLIENVDEEVILKVNNNRTIINRKAVEMESMDSPTMSQNAFMDEVSKDAERRYKDRQIRQERMETLKKQATLAFRRGEYEKALSLYTKAIDQIKDSCLLYNNRALTYIKLKFYDKAVNDIEWALKLNEDSLKAWLLLAKAHYLSGNYKEYFNAIKEAKERNREMETFIDEYVEELQK